LKSILQNITIWDSEKSPSLGYEKVVLWSRFNSKLYPDAVSIPMLAEKNGIELKNQFLSIIYNIGEIKLDKLSLIKHFKIRNGFNYWWLSLINEKCNYSKSLWINDAIYLLAFENWQVNQNISNITLVSKNKELADCLRLWCEKENINFVWQRLYSSKNNKLTLNYINNLLFKSIQTIIWFILYIINHWSLRGVGLSEWKTTKGKTTFITYSDNLLIKPGKVKFQSHYWSKLPDVFLDHNINTNWLHLFVKDSFLNSAKKAAKIFGLFNKNSFGKQVHSTLDSFINWEVLKNTFLDWTKLKKIWKKLDRELYINYGKEIIFWQFLQIDLKESVYGKTALKNIMDYNLFDRALKLLPKQKKGLYLQENQGWEFGLIQLWGKFNNDILIGVPHSSVRFWDLRYFFDKRHYFGDKSNQLPRPDMVAVNGKAARNSYIEGGYPENELVDVEALRYLHLINTDEKLDLLINENKEIIILVLGDYLAKNTNYQMRILQEACSSFPINLKIIVKSHPNYQIMPHDYPLIDFKLTDKKLSSLLQYCNIAYTSSVTSAAIDAFYSKIPVITALNPNSLNLSPLRGFNGVKYVSSGKELNETLIKLIIQKSNEVKIDENYEDYFNLDYTLNKWKNLLFVK